MATATYGGVAIFGRGVRVLIQDTEPEAQENAYPGVDGLETVHLGTRGRFAVVEGVHGESTPAALAAVQAVFRSYKDGVARTLVDTAGATWPYALLRTFDPQGKRGMDASGVSFQQYRAVFRLLV